MIQLPRTLRPRWLMVSICLTGSIVMLAHFDRAAATPPPPPQVIASSITRTAGSPQPNTPEFSGCGGINQPVVNADYEQQVVDLVNLERANRGLPPYKRVTALDEAARYHSADLGQDNYFSHDTYDRSGGNLVLVCSTWTRIGKYYSGATGENIAAGYATPQSVMDGWMNSTGHRNNILSTGSWEIGVGYAVVSGSGYTRYWTQDFGKRSGVYPLIINRDAANTDSRKVTLYLYGTFQQMRLKNDSGAWGDWQTFQNNVAWTLANGVGTHTVSAELKTGSTVVTSSDTIYLTTAGVPQLGDLPDTLTFLYSIPQARLTPTNVTLTPMDVNTNDPITWTLTQTGTWFNALPSSGTSPQSFQITPGGFVTDTPAVYTGIITVTVSDPSDTIGSPHRIDLTLHVINTPLAEVYLPLVRR
jgi:uncharacterized protein YkwD